ncbi:hypothetical protein B0H10DRAFT_2241601 [Mycena sp. CBHHK59/15]|nr:hypothetical protein B0H10DRAFT_2241601 [Mycena sp. CBHHK59/15]
MMNIWIDLAVLTGLDSSPESVAPRGKCAPRGVSWWAGAVYTCCATPSPILPSFLRLAAALWASSLQLVRCLHVGRGIPSPWMPWLHAPPPNPAAPPPVCCRSTHPFFRLPPAPRPPPAPFIDAPCWGISHELPVSHPHRSAPRNRAAPPPFCRRPLRQLLRLPAALLPSSSPTELTPHARASPTCPPCRSALSNPALPPAVCRRSARPPLRLPVGSPPPSCPISSTPHADAYHASRPCRSAPRNRAAPPPFCRHPSRQLLRLPTALLPSSFPTHLTPHTRASLTCPPCHSAPSNPAPPLAVCRRSARPLLRLPVGSPPPPAPFLRRPTPGNLLRAPRVALRLQIPPRRRAFAAAPRGFLPPSWPSADVSSQLHCTTLLLPLCALY